ncbi:glutamate racemase [Teredinibacter turnerae]|uniref:glutamate racemase n=1 Tax=Teredinibacter turnerae TaxID=2426 RepID=UPI0003689A07|nr:glutamate racemase [Teredinibacter turnerae]
MPVKPTLASKNARILVLDSGAGGLTVAREILHRNPDVSLDYFADIAGFPYGTMPDDVLIRRLVSLVGNCLSQRQPDIVVLACNTASTLALHALRARYPTVEFVGVVPAIKPAASITRTGVIGLLATPATVNRDYTRKLIEDFAGNHEVVTHGSNPLVVCAEQLLQGTKPDTGILIDELGKLTTKSTAGSVDTIVLACTHFPLLLPYFKALPSCESISWVDSGSAIANRVHHLLQKLEQLDHSHSKITFIAAHSANDAPQYKTYAGYLLQEALPQYDILHLPLI